MGPSMASTLFLPACLCPDSILFCELPLRVPTQPGLLVCVCCAVKFCCFPIQLGIKTRLQDFLIVFTRRNCEFGLCVDRCGHFRDALSYSHSATIRVNDPSPSQWFILLMGKVTHCLLRFYIPYQFMPLTTVVGIINHLSTTRLHLTTLSLSPIYTAVLQSYSGGSWQLLVGADLPNFSCDQ